MSATDTNFRPRPVGKLFEPITLDAEALPQRVVEAVTGLSVHDLATVLGFVYAIKNDRGADSPVEAFLVELVRRYGACSGSLTFETVEERFSELRGDWECLLQAGEDNARRYPHLFAVMESQGADGAAPDGEASGH